MVIETAKNLKIINIAHGGWGVARVEGKVIFVAGAIPGDTVDAEVFQSKKNFAKADAISVIEPSPTRRSHIWPEADIKNPPSSRPGGADYGHISYPAQLRYKSQILKESMQKFAKLEIPDGLIMPISENELGWRTRVDLHVNEQGVIGPFAERTNNVIKVQSLPLATEAINKAGLHNENFAGAETVRVIDNQGEIRLVIDEQKPTTITEFAQFEFKVADTGFWQVHTHAATTLFEAVSELIDENLFDPKADNHDLYGGVGLLAAAIANKDIENTKVISVESDAGAVDYASENLSFAPYARSVESKVDNYLKTLVANSASLQGATVVMDPPRIGAGKDVMKNLTSMKASQIIYVACDPVALSRDVEYAMQSGYQLAEIKGYDLFPNTHHFEAVARLTL